MKEKMALEFNRIWYKHDTGEAWIIMANKAVEIISEEIEKVERAELLDQIKQAKAEVAREIFEEIEELWGRVLSLSTCDESTRPHSECRWCSWQSLKDKYPKEAA